MVAIYGRLFPMCSYEPRGYCGLEAGRGLQVAAERDPLIHRRWSRWDVALGIMIRMSRDREPVKAQRPLVPVMPSWVIWVGALMFPLLALGLMRLLLLHFVSGTPQDRMQLDVIKTAGGIVMGTGGAIALLLNARRQRSTEIALRLQDADIAQKELAAEDTRHDAAERRITELYNAAVEQLGSPNAPVRLGGLYALERLAQDNHGHRQTVVEVLCAYLRMPDPDEPLDKDLIDNSNPSGKVRKQRREEHQVRRAAQHILIRHLRTFGASDDSSRQKFWPGIEIDLNGATLHNWNFANCLVESANFSKTIFRGKHTDFSAAAIEGFASFNGAKFYCSTSFSDTKFADYVAFSSVTFFDAAVFEGTSFHGGTTFAFSEFMATAKFHRVNMHEDTIYFSGTFFHADAWFGISNGTVSIIDKIYAKRGKSVSPFPPGAEFEDPIGEKGIPASEWCLIVQHGWASHVP